MEEKRGLMGRNTSLSNDMVCSSLIGTSDSKTAIIDTDSAELLKYCALGLAGANPSLLCSILVVSLASIVLHRTRGNSMYGCKVVAF